METGQIQRTDGLPGRRHWCALLASLALLLLISCTPEFQSTPDGVALNANQSIVPLDLSEKEKHYIAESPPLAAGISDGAAPLLYIDSTGSPQGIGIRILEEISRRSGLTFTYHIYSSMKELQASGSDIYPLLVVPYAWDSVTLSDPYLVTDTVLYLRQGIRADQLSDKRYAAVRGGVLPDGIGEEQVVYFENREEAIEAVDQGKADFGYGNAYSIAYLSLKNDYRNLITVPQGKEIRRYGVGVHEDNRVLLSIVNKTLASITDSQMQSLILDVATKVERKISVSMIMGQYGGRILFISLLVIVTLTILSSLIVRSTRQLRRQNSRYEALFEISQEYLFEYEDHTNTLMLSPRTLTLFGSKERAEKASEVLGAMMREAIHTAHDEIISLEVADGSEATFRLTTVKIYDPMGRQDSYIGRLSDISEQEREKAVLRTLVVTDGLTGVLNQVAVRQRIETELETRPPDRMDVLILMDCDKFKHVNDTFGHLEGDRYLVTLAESLVAIFPAKALIGRVGGDEFCVYLKDIDSIDEVLELSALINPAFQERLKAPFTISIGITTVQAGDDGYVDLFRRADIALYEAKDQGGGMARVYTL